MAISYVSRSSCRNLSAAVEDKLADTASTERSITLTPTLAISRAPTLAPAIASSSDNKLLKQFMIAYLEFRMPSQIEVDSETCNQLLKAWFLDLYYGNLHINCYQFYK